MRIGTNRFQAMVGHWNRWETHVDWTNNGGSTWYPATFLAGQVTCSARSTIRWVCDLKLADVEPALDGINAYSTQIRITHGMPGELFPFGVYKVTDSSYDSGDRGKVLSVKGSSFEAYLQAALFVAARTFPSQPASRLAAALIQEILPGAVIDWQLVDDQLPKITQAEDRWGLIDGTNQSVSIARTLGGDIFAGAAGNWIARPTPTLYDDPVWTAAEGEGGVLFSHGEALSDDKVFNVIVASGQSSSTDFPPFKAGVAMDLDPTSPTYALRAVTQGGFGLHVLKYQSELLTSHAKAQAAAEAMLAPYLGLKQQVTFSQAHNPLLEPGDVGIVQTLYGPRRVLLDEITYDLLGGPLQAQTRTTATTLTGDAYVPPDDSEGS